MIAKEGSANDREGFVQSLWEEANSHFEEVAHFAKRDESGNIGGIWGAYPSSVMLPARIEQDDTVLCNVVFSVFTGHHAVSAFYKTYDIMFMKMVGKGLHNSFKMICFYLKLLIIADSAHFLFHFQIPPCCYITELSSGRLVKYLHFLSVSTNNGQLKDKGSKKAQRNCIAPHINDITDKAEPAVASCPEYAGNQGGVYGSAHDIIGINF